MKSALTPLLGLLLIVAISACHNSQEKESSTDSMAKTDTKDTIQTRYPGWVKKANIYEVNIRQYTPEGTINAFAKNLPRLKKMGVDILWIMPVQPVGKKNRKGKLGSNYSIQNYTAVNPNFGTLDDFKAMVKQAHDLGMHVILDWVANHTAWDNVWMTEHPDFYTLINGKPTVALDNNGKPTDWTDVADLNYKNPELRKAMVKSMEFWIQNCDIDGFRCDVAGFVPLDFWTSTRQQLDSIKPMFMLAEWEDYHYYKAFDMTYAWEFHALMNEVAQGKKPAEDFNDYLAKQDTLLKPQDIRMYFTTNHDENAWNGTVFERMGKNNQGMYVLCATFPHGMPLIYGGQEAGLNKRLRFFAKDTIDWSDTSLVPFYTKMLDLKHRNPTLWNGPYEGNFKLIQVADTTNQYAFARTKGDNTVLVFLNFGKDSASFHTVDAGLNGKYTNWLTKQPEDVVNGKTIEVPAQSYVILAKGFE